MNLQLLQSFEMASFFAESKLARWLSFNDLIDRNGIGSTGSISCIDCHCGGGYRDCIG